MKNIVLEKEIKQYFEKVNKDITPENDETLIHLKRIAGWNKDGYNPQKDKDFIEDALWSISIKIKPIILNEKQKEQLSIKLKEATNKKTAYKIIYKISKYINKAFFM